MKEENKSEIKDDSNSEKDVVQNRQFITLEAETGKEFVLVVDYYKNKKEVKFLTELNEDNLKTLIKVKNDESNFSSKLKELENENLEVTKNENIEEKKNSEEKVKENNKPKSKEKSNVIGYLALIVLLSSLGIVIYFKK